VKRKLFQLSFLSALLATLVCAGAAMATDAGKPLGFGTADIPEIPRQNVNQTLPRTVQLLIDAIPTAHGSQRIKLIADLGKCKRAEAQPTLFSLLKDPSADTRAEAARSLGAIGDKASITNLEKCFSDVDPSVRREAVIAAATLGDVNATRIGITDADGAVQQAACAFAVMPQSITILSDAMKSLPTAARTAALESLATEKASGQWQPIANCLKGSTSERYAVLRALAAMKVAASEPAILPMLQDGSGIVRREAMVALSHIASPHEMQQIAFRMLEDSDLTVRAAAAEVLSDVPTESAIPMLVEQLSQENEPLRQSARNALIAIGPAAITPAAKLLMDSDDQRQEDGSYILGHLHSRDHLQQHLALLKSSKWLVVKQAARSLELIGEPSAGPALASVVGNYAQLQEDKSASANNSLDAVVASILSAAHLGCSALLPSIKPLIAQLDAEPTVRQAAIYAFGILGSASDSATCHELLSTVENPEEVLFTRLEAAKALGQLRYKHAENVLAAIDSSEANLQFRWVARWARQQITGQTYNFLVPPMNWSADVSITDLPGEPTGEQQISGTIGFEGTYLAGAWVPVHLMFRNDGSQAIEGTAAFAVNNGSESATVRLPCVVPAKSAVNRVAYGYFPYQKNAGQLVATTVEWTDNQGRSIARAPIAARQLSAAEGFGAESNNSLDTVMICLTDSSSEQGGRGYDVHSASNLAKTISERIGFAIKAELLPIQSAPRHPAGYESSRIVVLDADPDQLDTAQRQALLDHIRTGGELLLCATPIKPGSWLSQYQPVIPLGQREVSGIQATQASDQVPFAQAAKIVEAADVAGPDTVVVAGDSQLIHVAIRPMGMGCVAFTSFPINALDGSDDHSVALWKNIFQSTTQSPRVLTTASAPLLGELVGIPTQPISVPIAIIAAYIATVVLAHRFFTNASRPWAYVVTLGVGMVGFACLGATSILRTPRHELTEARLSVLSLGPSGGGRQEELIAFAGSDDPSFGFTADPDATVRSLGSSEREGVQIQELPFAVTRAGVHPMEIKQIWSADSSLDAKFRVKATARFGPSGLAMNVDNGLDESLKRPLLVWGAAWSLPEIAQGTSAIMPLGRNSRGDFVSTGAVRLDIDGLRSAMVSNVLSAGGGVLGVEQRGAMLFGWVNDVPSAIRADQAKIISQNVLCVPVVVMPSESGSVVSVDGSYCRIVPGPGPGAPYDSVRGQWIPGNLSGEWIIGFAPPAEIGTLRPTRVMLNADISAPTQTITLMRGLCAGGKVAGDIPGTALCQWNQPISAQTATFECDSNDFDSGGCVWIRLRVESNSANPSSWFFRNLEMNYVANVIAGPAESRLKRD
jgi:HEAT repeat protein